MKKITALLAVAALGLAACGSSDDNSSSAASSSSGGGGAYGGGTSKTTSSSSSSSASGSEVKVNLVDNAFQPKTITGKPGSTVKVELKNTGHTEHNFSVDSQKISKDIEEGEDATVSVKIPASGSVPFYCEYHKGLGMTGTLKAS